MILKRMGGQDLRTSSTGVASLNPTWVILNVTTAVNKQEIRREVAE